MANVVTSLPPGSQAFTVLASAARTAQPDTQEFEVPGGYSALYLVVDATSITLTPSITVSILGVDRLSGKTHTILTGAAVTTVSTQVLRVGPGLTAGTNIANDYLPSVFRISVAHGDADSITYSIAGMLCP